MPATVLVAVPAPAPSVAVPTAAAAPVQVPAFLREPPPLPDPAPAPLPEPSAQPELEPKPEPEPEPEPELNLAPEVVAAPAVEIPSTTAVPADSPEELSTAQAPEEEVALAIRPAVVQALPAAPADEMAQRDSPAPKPEPEPERELELEPQVPSRLQGVLAAAPPQAPAQAAPARAEEPSFVRAARRQAFWRSAPVRVSLWVLCVLLTGLLAVQMAWHERDRLAAQTPALRPLLIQLCAALDCDLHPYRHIAAVLIDSSGLSKVAHGDSYQLQVTLKNTSVVDVAMPALELSLTDAQEAVLVRRVLLPDEWGGPAVLPAASEWSVRTPVALQGAASQLSGYRVLAFYP